MNLVNIREGKIKNLRGADLFGANLCVANLRGADLKNTCLDPFSILTADLADFERIRCRNNTEWIVAYRTRVSSCVGNTEYKIGEIYEAPVFSTCSDTECHPGIFFWPTVEAATNWLKVYGGDSIIQVLVRPWEIQQAGSKYRARWILVA